MNSANAIVGFCILLYFRCVFATYTETGECSESRLCSYSYFAHQEYADSAAENQHTEVNATVHITCISAGVYEEQNATLYCMDIKNPVISSTLLNDSSPEDKRYHQKSFRQHLLKWFCFVQTSNGKIPAVYHPPAELEEAVNLKKSIAAAFQANFQGTTEEEEEDSVSQHTSHYTYRKSEADGRLKMNRSIHESDIHQYSGDSKPDGDVESTIHEKLEYKDGILEYSSGNMIVETANSSLDDNSNEGGSQDHPSLSQTLSAKGNYQLTLQNCFKLSKRLSTSQKKDLHSKMEHSTKESLKAMINSRAQAFETMKALRKQLSPSRSVYYSLLNYKSFKGKLEGILIELMDLEAKYGVLPNYRSVLDDVISIMENEKYHSDRDLRNLIYELLTAESSLKAQLSLLNAFDSALEDEEANDILVHISSLDSVKPELIVNLGERLGHTRYQEHIANQLLLVYGSLAMKGNQEVEYRVLDQLIDIVVKYHNSTSNYPATVIIVALGNSGSKLSIPFLLSFLNSSNINDEEDRIPVVINALAKVTFDDNVLFELNKLLLRDSSLSVISAIIETLHDGLEYARTVKSNLKSYLARLRGHPILATLAEIVSVHNDSDIYSMTLDYFTEIQAPQEILDILHSKEHEVVRQKRYTTNWDYSSNSDYDYVASRASRYSDEINYPNHYAYLNSTKIGISDANLKAVCGLFAGISQCGNMKVFGRVIAVGKVLQYRRTIADAKLDLRLRPTLGYGTLTAYVKLGSSTLLNYVRRPSLSRNCWRMTRNVISAKRLLFRFRFSIFVYVGTLSLHVRLYSTFNLDLNANLCIDRTGTTVSGALGAISPSVGLILEGEVRGNLLSLARGGITVSVSLNYQLEPAVSQQICTGHCPLSRRMCIGLYDSFPNSNINLQAWYETRKVGKCGGWIKYPCIKWGRRRTWDDFSRTWSIGRRSRRPVWQRCQGSLYSRCAANALSSPLFSY